MAELIAKEIMPLKKVLVKLREEGRILLAILFGSFVTGMQHSRSDIDLAIYISPMSQEEEIETILKIVNSVDRDVSILRLDSEDESPFIVQTALKGVHLVEPDEDVLYTVADRALHESESIRFRRAINAA